MENYNNEIFGFGNDSNNNVEQTSDFDYDSISGLGQSDYENEDLFNTEVENNNSSIFDNYYSQESVNASEEINNVGINYVENNSLLGENEVYQNPFIQNFDFEQSSNVESEGTENIELVNPVDTFEEMVQEQPIIDNIEPEKEEVKMNFDPMTGEPIVNNVIEQTPEVQEYTINDEPSTEEKTDEPETFEPSFEQSVEPQETTEVEQNVEGEKQIEEVPESITAPTFEQFIEPQIDTIQPVEEPVEYQEKIEISDTPIEEITKLTEFQKEKIEETDINALFDRVSVNVKDASDLFRKNTDIKQKIDNRFEELKKLQIELEHSRKKQLDEINKYKEEVLEKLTEKKEEIERRLNILKESQVTLEREKKEFEEYKKNEQENIDRVQKEVQSAYDDRREELNHIEDVLRKQKDALDEERSQLSLDRIQYESDKNELANNLLKFNEIVNSFTNGVNDTKE